MTVAELVRGVNILLGRAALDPCRVFDSNGDGKVAVNELVRAVADALYGCGVTPPTPLPTFTRTSTATPTSSPPPTATPTRTVGVPDVSGEWREDQYQLTSSTCIDGITLVIQELIGELPPCVYTVVQDGARLTITDCDGVDASGTVDASGVVAVDLAAGELTEGGCTLVLDPAFRGDLRTSPTTVLQSLDVGFEGTCAMPSCAVTVTTRWTRL